MADASKWDRMVEVTRRRRFFDVYLRVQATTYPGCSRPYGWLWSATRADHTHLGGGGAASEQEAMDTALAAAREDRRKRRG